MINLLIRVSGGMVKTKQQAEVVLYIISGVLLIFSGIMLYRSFVNPVSTPTTTNEIIDS